MDSLSSKMSLSNLRYLTLISAFFRIENSVIEAITLALLGVILAVFIPVTIRGDRLLARLEIKLDFLLKHNGIDPVDCLKKS